MIPELTPEEEKEFEEWCRLNRYYRGGVFWYRKGGIQNIGRKELYQIFQEERKQISNGN
jgi:hypothetical protein